MQPTYQLAHHFKNDIIYFYLDPPGISFFFSTSGSTHVIRTDWGDNTLTVMSSTSSTTSGSDGKGWQRKNIRFEWVKILNMECWLAPLWSVIPGVAFYSWWPWWWVHSSPGLWVPAVIPHRRTQTLRTEGGIPDTATYHYTLPAMGHTEDMHSEVYSQIFEPRFKGIHYVYLKHYSY